LHQALETMFPQSKKIELFARQARTGWITFGNQCETTLNIDIRNSLADLIC
jgi:N6-adenosine-specific RNA methylase IME4